MALAGLVVEVIENPVEFPPLLEGEAEGLVVAREVVSICVPVPGDRGWSWLGHRGRLRSQPP